MHIERIGVVGLVAGVMLGGIVAMAGCEGADDAVSGGDEEEVQSGFRLHRRHRGADAGSVAGTTGGATGGAGGTNGAVAPGGGAVADSDICAKAERCCKVLPGYPTCPFKAAPTCPWTVGEVPPDCAVGCITFVMAVRGTWGGNPPAECR
jgi:hypothetical protein